jgi:hypothetical protein
MLGSPHAGTVGPRHEVGGGGAPQGGEPQGSRKGRPVRSIVRWRGGSMEHPYPWEEGSIPLITLLSQLATALSALASRAAGCLVATSCSGLSQTIARRRRLHAPATEQLAARDQSPTKALQSSLGISDEASGQIE